MQKKFGWGDITKNLTRKALAIGVLLFAFISHCAYAEEGTQSSSAGSSSAVQENQVSIFTETNENNLPISNLSGGTNVTGNARSTGSGWIFFRMFLVLACVIGLAWWFLRFLKKKNETPEVSDDPFLRRVSSVSLGQGKSVQVVTLLNKAYILGVGEDSVTLISEVEDNELINSMNLYADKHENNPRPKTFEEVLEIFMPRKKNAQGNSTKVSAYDGSTKKILDALKLKRPKTGDEE